MTDNPEIERYWHEVQPWTVGRLRKALAGLPDDMVVRVEVAGAPSSAGVDPWGDDQFVIVDGAVSHEAADDDFLVRADFPTDWYIRAVDGA